MRSIIYSFCRLFAAFVAFRFHLLFLFCFFISLYSYEKRFEASYTQKRHTCLQSVGFGFRKKKQRTKCESQQYVCYLCLKTGFCALLIVLFVVFECVWNHSEKYSNRQLDSIQANVYTHSLLILLEIYVYWVPVSVYQQTFFSNVYSLYSIGSERHRCFKYVLTIIFCV